MGDGKKRIDGDKLLSFRSKHGQAQGIRPMFRTLKSNSPFSAPRDDTARASCGNGPKAISYHSLLPVLDGIEVVITFKIAGLVQAGKTMSSTRTSKQ